MKRFQSYLSGRKQRVKLEVSTVINAENGVPQESVLGSLLF